MSSLGHVVARRGILANSRCTGEIDGWLVTSRGACCRVVQLDSQTTKVACALCREPF